MNSEKKRVPPNTSYPVSLVSSVSNKELEDYIINNKGYKGYLGYRIRGVSTPLSREIPDGICLE